MSPLLNRPKVVIYSKPGCHLCDEAKQTITTAVDASEYTLEEINIEDDSDLLRRYRYDIPVITINGKEEFRHRLSAMQFKQALARHS